MKVLIITPTYGRIPFLNRLLASFLSQDYDDKELVIINDDRNVELCCDYKNVTCINMNKKILVGQKRNIAVQLGFYDLYMPHDDDDIFLPSRISNHVKIHEKHSDIVAYRNSSSYIVYGDKLTVGESSVNCISFTLDGWFNYKGYRHNTNCGEDQEFLNKLHPKIVKANTDELDFVYNFGGVNYHLSGTKDKDVEKIAHKQLSSLTLLNKKYYITPDFEEYNKFVLLDTLYKKLLSPIKVKHISLGKIDIA